MANELRKFTERFSEFRKPTVDQKRMLSSALREELLRRRTKVVRKLRELVDYSESGQSTTFFIDLPSGKTIAEAYLKFISSDVLDLQQISVGKMGNSKDFFRNLGVGTMLFEKIFDYCVRNRVKRLNLRVDVDNKQAFRLYERLGFVVSKKDSRFFYMSKKFDYS